jgi:hypothetical membrane protein
MSVHPSRSRSPLPRAGALLFTAGAVILMGIITAEALYPVAYSTFGNEISDLGATRPPHSLSYQPSAAIFDVTMLVAGAMILVAAWLVHRAFRRRAVTVSLACYGLGVFGVGLFPGDTAPHPYVALFVFLAAGVAALLARGVLAAPLRQISVVLGAITLASTFVGVFLLDWGPVVELGKGGVERWIAYPAVLWLTAFGGYLMGSRPGEPAERARPPATRKAEDADVLVGGDRRG